jgi:YtkA-like
MRRAVFLTLVLAALIPAADASAGCFATAGLVGPPDGLAPGATWTATITVKQHGVRPIPDAKPTLTIIGEDGSRKVFAAKPTEKVGVYEAAVVFPSEGTWNYVVNDGFVSRDNGQSWSCATDHTFSAVTIGTIDPPAPASPAATAAPATDDGAPAWLVGFVLASIALGAAAALAVLARRFGRPHARA